ncbi:MAG: 2-amino-4-hydroxy-6-hydroxymethyldihydropteridine diphosphokinase [Candidatus Atribacteria bacterium]|nr:2-amino-4-hydroxy-6-hydroxymethyldihydropteridine diphosphokinase [Candidatus Atribacteria bacterium]
MNKAYLILGSNINPEINIPRALGFLDKSFQVNRISNTWQTRAVGSKSNDFFNTAVEIETGLDRINLKERCLCHIEEIMGRVRQKDKNAPRTIDIDIVIFNDQILEPEIFKREHLALPLSEILPKIVDPQTFVSLSEIANQFTKNGSAKIVGCINPNGS